MNYLLELRAFKDWCLINQPPTGQIALWHALMMIANTSGWQEWFSVPSQTLELLTGLSHSGIDKARKSLIDRNRIAYRPSDNRKKASRYKIIPLCHNMEIKVDELEDELRNELEDELEDELATQQRTSKRTINKLNKTKQNNKTPLTPQNEKSNYAEFVSLTNAEYEALVARLGSEQRVKRCIEILDNYKGASGRKYKSDYRAILNWVIGRLEEEEQKVGQPRQLTDDEIAMQQLIERMEADGRFNTTAGSGG